MRAAAAISALRPYSSRLLTTPSDLAPMSTRISSLSMRTTVPSTTSPCLKLLMSESCSASSSSIVVGSGPVGVAGRAGARSSWLDVLCGRRVGRFGLGGGARRSAAAAAPRRRAARPSRRRARRRRRSALGGASGCAAGASARLPRRERAPGPASAVGAAAPRFGRRSSVAGLVGRCHAGGVRTLGGGLGGDSVAAGSSATAIAATVCSDAGASRRRWPPAPARSRPAALRSSDRVSCRWIRPGNHETAPSTRPGRLGDRGGSVVTLAGGPLLRADRTWTALQLSCPEGPGESSTRAYAGTIAAPCPSCPTSTVVADAFHAALAGRSVTRAQRARAARGPGHAGRARGARRAARRRAIAPTWASSWYVDLDRDRDRGQPDAHRPVPARGARREAAAAETAVVLAFGPRGRRARRPTRRLDGRRRRGCPPTTRRSSVRYRDPTQMGKVYLLPAGVDRPVPGLGDRTRWAGRRSTRR